MAQDLEDILNHIGQFGRFQILLNIVINLTDAASAWGMLIMTLAGATPDWWCPDGNPGGTTESTSESTPLYGIVSATTNTTMVPKIKYCPEDGGLCPNITYSTEFTSIVSEWHLVCGNSWMSGIITTIQMAGVLVGALIAGQLGDLIGRKKTLFIVYVSLIITNFITAFSVSVEMYTALRFFVGISSGGLLVTSFVLPMEYIGKKYRTFSNMVPMWVTGTVIMSGLAYYITDWRKLAITMSCIGTPYVLFWWFIPESSRWLMARGRFKEAEDILHRIVKFNKKPKLTEEQLQILRNIALRDLEERKNESKYTFLDLFRTWQYAKKTLLLLQLWFSCGLIYYGMTFGVKNLEGDRYVNLILNSVIELPAYISLVINFKLGRRYTIVLFLCLTVLPCIAIPVMLWTGNYENNSNAVFALSLTAKLAISGTWSVVMVFTAEQYPTVVRYLGFGACNTGSRVGAMISPLIVELHSISASIPYLVFGVLIVISCVCALLLTETKDQNMLDYLPPRQQKRSHELNNKVELKELMSDESSVPL